MKIINKDRIELFNLSENEFISIIEKAKQDVINAIGPFEKTNISVKIIEKGGGGCR